MAVRYVLDTDALSLLIDGHEELLRRVRQLPPEEIGMTVITVEEHLTGWYSLIRRARQPEKLEAAYQALADATRYFSAVPILNYNQPAIARYAQLKAQRLNIGGMDLRIAAIVLEAGAVLVTRNLRDFNRIPGLKVEDWTQPIAPANGNGEPAPTQPPPE